MNPNTYSVNNNLDIGCESQLLGEARFRHYTGEKDNYTGLQQGAQRREKGNSEDSNRGGIGISVPALQQSATSCCTLCRTNNGLDKKPHAVGKTVAVPKHRKPFQWSRLPHLM